MQATFRRPGSRRLTAASALFASVTIAIGAKAVASEPPPDIRHPEIDALQAVPRGRGALAQAALPHNLPEPTARSLASRSEYSDLAPNQAADLAAEVFAGVIEQPGSEKPELPPGTEIGGYVNDYVALVEPTDGSGRKFDPESPPEPGGAIVSPILPLRTENESNILRPIDTELVDTGVGYEQKNALVDVEMPDDLADGVSLPGAGLAVEPAGASAAAAAETVSDKVVYANLGGAEDTDFISAPMPAGFQFMLQLRSGESPSEHRVHLDLPPGAVLQPSDVDPGGVDIISGNELLGTITQPEAFDAAGRQVPVQMHVVDGADVAIEVGHLDAGWEFPILVDPVVDYYGWRDSVNPGGYPTDMNGWFDQSSNPAKFTGYFTNGLNSRSNPSTVYPNGAYHEWLWKAPTDTFIERVDMYGAEHVVLSGDSQVEKNLQGIWSTSANWWQGGNQYVRGGLYDGVSAPPPPTPCNPINATSPFGYTSGYNNYSMDHWVGSNCNPDWTPYQSWGPDVEGDDSNEVVFGLQMEDTGATLRQCCARAHLRGAAIYLYDRYAPQMTSAQPSPPATWVDDSAAQTHSVSASATDRGLGMSRYDVHVNWGATDGSERFSYTALSCSGNRTARCPTAPPATTKTVNYQLPEGKNKVELVPFDVVGWWQQPWQTWTEFIDRSAPTALNDPGGSLYANRADIRGEQAYTLTASARDGNSSTNSAMRSGVKRLEVWVDDDADEPDFSIERSAAACNLAGGACPSTFETTWQVSPYQLGEGQHTLRVVATDQAGHQSTVQQFTINVTTDIESGRLTLSATPPAPDGSYDIVATALEERTPTRPVSGMARMELLVNGTLVQEHAPGCPAGNCDLIHTFHMQPSQSLASNEVSLIAYDRAGNSSIQDLGATQNYYEYFGYNDGWDTEKKVLAAYNGGSNMLRLPVDWCYVANNDRPPFPGGPAPDPRQRLERSQWQWGRFEGWFDKIKRRNDLISAPGEKLRVVADLYGAPRWAWDNPGDGTQSQCSPGGISTTPPKTEYVNGDESDWSYFVAEFTRRFGPTSPYAGAQLSAIQLWNEPNLPKFWGGASANLRTNAPQRFAGLVNAGSAAVDTVSTSTEVLPGAMSPVAAGDNGSWMSQASFMSQAAQNIVANRIDGLAIHLYADGAPSDDKAVTKITRRFNKLVDNAGSLAANRPRWITEIGFPSSPVTNESPNTQRRRLKLAYKKLEGIPNNNIKAFIVHRLEDDPDNEARLYGVLPKNLGDCKRSGQDNEAVYRALAKYRKAESRAVCPPANP